MKFSTWYRYGEKVLYDYQKNAERLSRLQEELTELEEHGDVGVQRYSDRGGYSGFVSDRVADYVHRTESLRKRIAELTVRVKAVQKLRRVLRMTDVADENFREEASAVLEYWYIESRPDDEHVALLDKARIESIRHWLVKRASKYIDRLREESR